MKVLTDVLTGARFNDYTELDTYEYGDEKPGQRRPYGAQVCAKHAKEFNMRKGLSRGLGVSVCGIVGCNAEAEHYYEFNTEATGHPEKEKDESPTTSPAAETEESTEEKASLATWETLEESGEEGTLEPQAPTPPAQKPRRKAKRREQKSPEKPGVIAMID